MPSKTEQIAAANAELKQNALDAAEEEQTVVQEISTITPNQKIFHQIFEASLLKIFNELKKAIATPAKPEGKSTNIKENLANLAQNVTSVVVPNQNIAKAAASGIHLIGDIASLVRDIRDERAKSLAENFLEKIQVDSESELSKLAMQVAAKLYFRFKRGIDELADNDEGIKQLAEFFVSAIKAKLGGTELFIPADSLADMLVKNAIPNEKSNLYGKPIHKKLKTIKNYKKEWTIIGLLLHSPAITINGDVLENQSVKTHRDEKYPPQLFATLDEAHYCNFKPASKELALAVLAKEMQILIKDKAQIQRQRNQLEENILEINENIKRNRNKLKLLNDKMKDKAALKQKSLEQNDKEYAKFFKSKQIAERNIAIADNEIEKCDRAIQSYNASKEKLSDVEKTVGRRRFHAFIKGTEEIVMPIYQEKIVDLKKEQVVLNAENNQERDEAKNKKNKIKDKIDNNEIELMIFADDLEKEKQATEDNVKQQDEKIQILQSKLMHIAQESTNQQGDLNDADVNLLEKIEDGKVEIVEDNKNIGAIFSNLLNFPSKLTNLSINKEIDDDELPLLLVLLSSKNLALKSLVLSNTQLQDDDVCNIVEVIISNKDLKLTELRLEKNSIGNNAAQALKKLLMINKTLLVLNISHTRPKLNGKDLAEIAKGLKYNTCLQQLLLDYNGLDATSQNGLSAFAHAVKSNPESKLTSLDFTGNPLGLIGISCLINIFNENSHLKGFKFENTSLNDPALELLCNAIMEASVSIDCIDLSENNFTSEGAIHLSKLLARKQPRSLTLNNCEWGDQGALNLVYELKVPAPQKNNVLKYVAFRGMGITHNSLKEFLLPFIHDKELTSLSLQLNKLGSEGLEILCNVIAESKSAVTLNGLYLGNIESVEPLNIAPLIKLLSENKLPNIKVLDLSCNSLQDEDALLLAQALQNINKYFWHLWLHGNRITRTGLLAILQSLAHHEHIEKICIHENLLTPEDMQLLKNHPEIQSLVPKLIQWLPSDFAKNKGKREKMVHDKFESSLQEQLKNSAKIQIDGGVLSCSPRKLTDAQAIEVAQVIQKAIDNNNFIIELNLSKHQFTGKGITEIFKPILANEKQRKALKGLNLFNNPLGDEGAIVLADFISKTELHKLEIKKMGISDVGINAILKALNECKTGSILQKLTFLGSPLNTSLASRPNSRSSSVGSQAENPFILLPPNKPSAPSSSTNPNKMEISNLSMVIPIFEEWYTDLEISTLVRLKVEQMQGYAKNCNFLLAGNEEGKYLAHDPEEDKNKAFFVLITPALETENSNKAIPINFFLDKAAQQAPEMRDDRKDVFDEIKFVLDQPNDFNIKILFPYNITNIHWLTGEIKISRNNHIYHIVLTAHDPKGNGEIAVNNRKILTETIIKKIKEHNHHVNINDSNFTYAKSSYSARQSREDGNACGVIVVEDIIKRIEGKTLSQPTPYPSGAHNIRKAHVKLIKQHLLDTDPIRIAFLSRHESAPIELEENISGFRK